MSPELKEVLDYLLAFLAPGAAGGIILGVLGWMKASREKPHIAPAPSPAGLPVQIGGMVMSQQELANVTAGLHAIATAQDRCTLVREAEMEQAKKLANERHEEARALIDGLRTLNDRLRDLKCVG